MRASGSDVNGASTGITPAACAHRCHSRIGVVACSLFLALTPLRLPAAPKPIAIVASGNASGGDAKFFRHYVTAELGVVAEERGEFLDPAEFAGYSLIAWLRGSPRLFTSEELTAMKRYMESGGHVLMTSGVPYNGLRLPFEGIDWVKATTWTYNRHSWEADIFDPRHPYLAGVSTNDAAWLKTCHALVDHEGIRLLGKDNATTFGYTDVGQGRFIFSSYGPYDARDEESKAAVMQIYRNIVTAADPLTEQAQAEALLADAAPGKAVVLWHRDWSGSTTRRLLWQPAGPRPDECLRRLDLQMVQDEIDTTFFCVQTTRDTGPLSLSVDELEPGKLANRLTVLVMGQAPLVQRSTPEQYANIDISQRGPFYLVPPEKLPPEGLPAFEIEPFTPRTVWVQVDTHGLPAGNYETRLELSTADGTTAAELPIRVHVAPIRMPSPRIVQLRTWGGGIGRDPRLAREMQRQGCDNGMVAYVERERTRLRNSDVTLSMALRNPEQYLRGSNSPPRLDFTDCWGDSLNQYLQHGLTHITYKDARTGFWWATAVTGEKCTIDTPFEQWPPAWRDAVIDYYTQVQDYFSERGYGMIFPIWTDEPSMDSIRNRYLPLAKAYVRAGMGPGSHWTTPGWMTPEDANVFLPWTRNISMYQYGYQNLLGFLRDGSVTLGPGSIVGFTRGGTGLAVRAPHVQSRLGPWSIVHQQEPAHFWRTGPIWKGWLYYVDFTANAWFRLGGVQGERLVAYGSSDPGDLASEMLTSSDWEGAREGVDDANLARMVEWYLPRMKARAGGAWKTRLEQIEAERKRWFADKGPFPIRTKPTHYKHNVEGETPLDYQLDMVAAESTRDIVTAKHTMITLLEEMRAHAVPADVQVGWHDMVLIRDGKPQATIIVSPAADAGVQAAAASLAGHIGEVTGIALAVKEADEPTAVHGTRIIVGQAADALVAELLRTHAWQLNEQYPGKGGYRILRLPDQDTVAILGVDAAGTLRGVENWKAFLFPEGHWLLEQQVGTTR